MMQPEHMQARLQDISMETFFEIPPYDLERARRCLQRNTPSDPLPTEGGIYAIWGDGDPYWAYVGQSNNLLKRIQQLQGIFQAREMPFTDPHKCAPALWSWMQSRPDLHLEVAVAPLAGVSAYWRQGFETFVIAWHRWHFGCSPHWQFGRMPRGWAPSTERKRGVRGKAIPAEVVFTCHRPGIAPLTNLFDDHSDPLSEHWAGHHWSPWYASIRDVPPGEPGQRGIYRLQRRDQLLFLGIYGLGQSDLDVNEEPGIDCSVGMPLRASSSSLSRVFHEARRQGAQASFVSGPWEDNQLRELLGDAVALYLRQQFTLPRAQFGGDETRPQLSRLQDPLRYLCTLLPPVKGHSPFPLAG